MRFFRSIAALPLSVLLVTDASASVMGRYVHVFLPGQGGVLTLAEV